MASAGRTDDYPFTDPLGAFDRAGARRRVRHVHALVYGGAAVALVLAALTDGGPASQRLAAAGVSLTTGMLALAMLAWRQPPDRLLVAAFPMAALTVTSVAVLDPPLSLTPMFYVWPLLTSAYFLRRREGLATYGVVCLSFGAVLPWAVDDGTQVIQWLTVVIVGGVVVALVTALKDGLQARLDSLGALANEDPLTGALNRRAVLEHLQARIARASAAEVSCAVAIFDVDHFKDINDSYGHAAGDDALRRLVVTVSERLADGDAVGRLGGEEFAVVLADGAGAVAHAEDLRRRIAAHATRCGHPFTVSVGVAALGDGGEPTAEGLIAAADAALYRAKRAGRDTVRAA